MTIGAMGNQKRWKNVWIFAKMKTDANGFHLANQLETVTDFHIAPESKTTTIS